MAILPDHYKTPLSARQVVALLVGTVCFCVVAYLARAYLYPLLGARVIGISGLAPFLIAWAIVLLLLLRLNAFRGRETLIFLLSVPAAIAVGILSLVVLARSLPT